VVLSEEGQLVVSLFSDAVPGAEVDLVEFAEDDDAWQGYRDLLSPTVEVQFVAPPGGLRVMEQAFEGFAGLRAGWRDWAAPGERVRLVPGDEIDAGDGRVLLLTQATGLMRDTGAEVPQETAVLARVDGGKIVEIGFYLSHDQARRDAGLD
jgi:ketosteroid isomerase-like protein